ELYRDDQPAGPGSADSDDDRYAPENAPRESRDQAVPSEPVPPEASPAPSGAEARIVFDVSPPDAAIYVDDRFAGSARELDALPEGLAVSAGEHRVVVTCPGYREATTRVQVSGTRIGRAAISLQR
ncbi:MAG TPA: PEGA domain-containing protein, partial [Thermoanaerobaculia bacterium]|nr:PEGA domain-containing protein [Thermoanaerobaculia bacterium]